jgi:hypothetical protein
VSNIETNPTNYYQLFYKLLDIMLTIATIVLLAFTNMIASIKFVFMLYPRSIVVFLFLYFLFYYLVDFNKVDTYFHRALFDQHDQYHHSSSHQNHQPSFVISSMRSAYSYLFPHRGAARDSIEAPS